MRTFQYTFETSKPPFISVFSICMTVSLSLQLYLKNTFCLQSVKSLFIIRLSLALKLSETLPKYGKTKVYSFLGIMKLSVFLINSLF